MVVEQLMLVAVSVLIGGLPLSHARRQRRRARELSGLATDEGETGAAHQRTVEGPVEVERPAEPRRDPPEHYDEQTDATPALWAWRVQKEQNRGEGSNYWKTLDSGLAVGEFDIRDDWERVRVDAESLGEVEDPFEADHLYLGDPNIDVSVEQRDGLLGKLGGDYGPLKDVEFSISVGRETTTPNRYQATVLREGDELLARGRADETGDTPTLRGDPGVEIGVGDLSGRAERLHRSARQWGAFGAGLIVLGVAVAGGTLLV